MVKQLSCLVGAFCYSDSELFVTSGIVTPAQITDTGSAGSSPRIVTLRLVNV